MIFIKILLNILRTVGRKMTTGGCYKTLKQMEDTRPR